MGRTRERGAEKRFGSLMSRGAEATEGTPRTPARHPDAQVRFLSLVDAVPAPGQGIVLVTYDARCDALLAGAARSHSREAPARCMLASMNVLCLWLAVGVQAAPVPEGPQPQVVAAEPAPATAQPQVAAAGGGDEGIRLARYYTGEQQYSERLGRALGQDLSAHWADYQEDQKDRAEDRADGDDDEDSEVQSFAQYMDDKYRGRLKVGGILLGIGFGPLGAGLYLGLTLGEGGFAVAGIGGVLIVTGAVLLGVRGTQLRRLREVQAGLALGPGARLRWRGLAPLHDPHLRTYGASVGFAF